MDLDAGTMRDELENVYSDDIQFGQTQVDEYTEWVDEAIDEDTLTYRGMWGLAGQFTEYVEENMGKNPDPETEELYLRSELAAFGGTLGAMMEDLGVPEKDLRSRFRLGGTMPRYISIRSGIWNDGFDTGMYSLEFGEVDSILNRGLNVGYSERDVIER
jgi:hypothetical protein